MTEYPAINSPIRYLQAVIFISLGVGLLLVLPLVTKKRIQCALFCPLEALQSLLGRLNPYRIRIDRNRCTGCNRCIEACPTFSITNESMASGRATSTCSLCGKSVDDCPDGAIVYAFGGLPPVGERVRETPSSVWHRAARYPFSLVGELADARTMFIFTAILFRGILSGSFVPMAFWRVFEWVRSAILPGNVL